MPSERLRRLGVTGVRTFRSSDADAILAIAQESPEASQWSPQDYLKLATDPGALALVIETAGEVTGFLVGRQAADQAEVLNLAVKTAARRQGAGSALLEAAFQEFATRRAKSIYLEVRESNTAAIAFYQRHGFCKTGMRPGYYREPDEAAVTMMGKLTV